MGIGGGIMDLVKGVYELAEEFLNQHEEGKSPLRQNVEVQNIAIQQLANQMLEEGKVNFYDKEPQEASNKDEFKIILRELVASSINYCYWYGSSTIRPMDSSSGSMYELVDAAIYNHPENLNFESSIKYLIELLSLYRYPLLEERKRHLLELVEDEKALTFARYVQVKYGRSGSKIFEELVKNFQGFASDIFLKRASLFMIQLYRQLGWFEEFMKELFVPADYQVPKMLNHFKAILYSNSIGYKIQEGKLIEKGSLMECQLRAATIVACKRLCNLTGWNVADVDTWLWTKRKLPQGKFHLTITTDY